MRKGKALRLHRFFIRLAFACAGIFSWIFAFQYFYIVEGNPAHALARVILLYALAESVVCLVTPLAARSLRKGAQRSLVIACLWGAAAFAVLAATFDGVLGFEGISLGVTLFAIFLGVYRASYWVPYEVDSEDARVPKSSLSTEVILAFAPFVAGVFLATSMLAFVLLLLFAALLMLISILPLRHGRETFERFSWSYRETFGELIFPENRRMFWQSFLEGVSGATFLFLWPIAIFPILGWSYSVLGAVLTISFLLAIVLRAPVQTFLRRMKLHESRFVRVTLAVSPWILRAIVASPLSIIIVDSYFYTTSRRGIGIDPVALTQAADSGSLLDERTALKEIALALGRISVCALTATLMFMVSPAGAFLAAFLLAAGASVIVL